MIFSENNIVAWRMPCFYGYPERTRRRDSWNLIRKLSVVSSLSWCICGNFNDLMYLVDKKGRNSHPQYLLDGFRNVVEDYHLSELALTCGKFNWERCRGTNNWVREKLDRCFATNHWWSKFPPVT